MERAKVTSTREEDPTVIEMENVHDEEPLFT